jgi:ABC-type branched-subunit amino acid transport system substrate-binding protein
MKTLVSVLALLIGSDVMALAADQTLKFKLVAFYIDQKDGETHMVGATMSPNGTIGTKDFSVKEDQNGKGAGRSTYYFPDGSIATTDSFVDTATQTGGHVVGKIQIVSGTGAYQGATGEGPFDGDWGDKSPLKGAGLFNIELDVKTPGT